MAERAGESRPFRIALAGGSTPRRVYERLAERDLDWGSWHVWWSDERAV
ncbi:MAG: 6-phosphogluconolactonase, partial [Actinobacteria bacterium]|nr:6-phosphogluconolactonase [Actinomycetota bacterium]